MCEKKSNRCKTLHIYHYVNYCMYIAFSCCNLSSKRHVSPQCQNSHFKKKSETQLTASIPKKRSKTQKEIKRTLFNWTKQDNSSLENLHVLSRFVRFKSILLISCVFLIKNQKTVQDTKVLYLLWFGLPDFVNYPCVTGVKVTQTPMPKDASHLVSAPYIITL